MNKIIARAFLLSFVGVTFYLVIAHLLDTWSVNGVIGTISELIIFGLIFCFALFFRRIIIWSVDNLDELKVNTSSFRVVDGELLPLKEEAPYSVNDAIKELKKMEYLKSLKQKQLSLKEPLTFEQWRDKNFFQFKDSNLWGSYKTEGVFTSRETFEIYRLGNTFL